MWILHQNKEVILNTDNVLSIEYSNYPPHSLNVEKKHAVICWSGGEELSSDIMMGTYLSKERCLEVIQDIVKNIHLKNPTYEMPEK